MMDYFRSLVNLKNKSVVDLVYPKHLNVHSGGYYYEYDHKSKDVRLNAGRNFYPLVSLASLYRQR